MVPVYGLSAHVYCRYRVWELGVDVVGVWVVCELFLPYKAFVTLTRRAAAITESPTELGSSRTIADYSL